ncbi:MAG: methyltransferase domain-containing protein [Phycisphaerales bacterium]|nr:MAG: methyltransferase domain-containing protein [Phycisphaerales bacterium]
MSKEWTAEGVLALAREYQTACVLAAAADLDLFRTLGSEARTAGYLASKLGTHLRGTTVLLDALVALELLDKEDGAYAVPPNLSPLLGAHDRGSVLAMIQHQANCLRRWAQLTVVVRSGKPAVRRASIRGEEADNEAFINAMDNVSAPVAAEVIREIGPFEFTHLLDVGGASGTWTIALLKANPEATATLFDLPEVIPLAERRLREAGLSRRVRLVAGDFDVDPLPEGADLAWVSAIIHQNSREQNRQLFARVFEALAAGGRVVIRDVLMDESRTSPPYGAMFAINMLVATEGGGTFTYDEVREDLESAGFIDVTVLRRDEGMNSVFSAVKPVRD